MQLVRWRLDDQPLSIQFIFSAGIIVLASLASIALLLIQIGSQTLAAHWVVQTHHTLNLLHRLERSYFRQEAAVIEFIKTTDPTFASSAMDERRAWDEGFQSLHPDLDDDATKQNFKLLGENYATWSRLTDRILAVGRGTETSTLEAEAVVFKEVGINVDRMIDWEEHLLAQRDRQRKRAVQTTIVVVSLINALLLVVFGLALRRLYRSIAKPIFHLSTTMRRYQGGEFSARVGVSNRSQIGFLESSFNEMAEKIEAMVADLKNLDELKTDFISTVSHELRTPLTSIGGYVKLLIAGDAGPITETQKEFLYIVDTNVVRLTHLINDILDVEKMESGKVQLVREQQDLVSVLKECRDTFGILAAQKGLELRYKVPDHLSPIMGDRGRLVQVFMNLLSNAIKYTQSGFVEIEAEQRDFAVVVRVRDSGIGLSDQEQEKLFQKFYRTRSGLSSAESGTGLGLVIARGLVEAHGGRITVESTPGKGTVFSISLPSATQIVSVENLQDAVVEPMADIARSIWIVDPNSEDVRRMRSILERSEFAQTQKTRVKSFDSVEQITEDDLSTDRPSLVIIDPQHAQFGPLWSSLRQRLHKTVPVLMIGATVDAAAAFAQGATGLLTKPIDEREFVIAVKDLFAAKGWRILVADRNTDLRILIKRSLEQRGFIVDDVDRGGLVLGRLENEEYDLALIDMNFSDVSGVELLKAIRNHPRFLTLPVFVMLDEDKNPPSREKLISWGADQFVGKYRGIGGIVDAVCQYLDDRKQQEQKNG